MSCNTCFTSLVCRTVFYVLGFISLLTGTVIYLVGFFDKSWVKRTLPSNGSISNFGIWTACKDMNCSSVSETLPELGGAARGVEGLMTLTIILFILCLVGEILCLLPCLPQRFTKTTIQQNHVIELVISFTAVLGFLGLLLFAGEMKNKASRNIGQADTVGAGFALVLAGLLEIVLGSVLVACTRQIPTLNEDAHSIQDYT